MKTIFVILGIGAVVVILSILFMVTIAWVHHPYGIRNYYKHCKTCSHSLAVGNHPPCLECEDGSEFKEMDEDDIAFLRRQEGKQ